MQRSDHGQVVTGQQNTPNVPVGSTRKARLYTWRAMRWRCPVCGISPLFLPLRRVEGVTDWLDTLDGCPRCDYRFHREPGYFLMALWIINFGFVSILGVSQVLILDKLFDISTGALIFIILVTMWGLGILTARHTKALFLALDLFVHPHQDEAK